MWPIALPQTKVVHLLRLAWDQFKSKYVKGMETNRCGIKRIGCVSAAYPKRIHQRNGKESTAVSSVSAAYPRCVVEAHDRQTDFGLTMTVRFSSLEACNGPVATTVASSTATGDNGSSAGVKGAVNKWKQS
jgi:hypothetical protein